MVSPIKDGSNKASGTGDDSGLSHGYYTYDQMKPGLAKETGKEIVANSNQPPSIVPYQLEFAHSVCFEVLKTLNLQPTPQVMAALSNSFKALPPASEMVRKVDDVMALATAEIGVNECFDVNRNNSIFEQPAATIDLNFVRNLKEVDFRDVSSNPISLTTDGSTTYPGGVKSQSNDINEQKRDLNAVQDSKLNNEDSELISVSHGMLVNSSDSDLKTQVSPENEVTSNISSITAEDSVLKQTVKNALDELDLSDSSSCESTGSDKTSKLERPSSSIEKPNNETPELNGLNQSHKPEHNQSSSVEKPKVAAPESNGLKDKFDASLLVTKRKYEAIADEKSKKKAIYIKYPPYPRKKIQKKPKNGNGSASLFDVSPRKDQRVPKGGHMASSKIPALSESDTEDTVNKSPIKASEKPLVTQFALPTPLADHDLGGTSETSTLNVSNAPRQELVGVDVTSATFNMVGASNELSGSSFSVPNGGPVHVRVPHASSLGAGQLRKEDYQSIDTDLSWVMVYVWGLPEMHR